MPDRLSVVGIITHLATVVALSLRNKGLKCYSLHVYAHVLMCIIA